MDLASGYWQIPLAEEDINKTSFITESGFFLAMDHQLFKD
jgi:hypothetical protein